MKVYLGDSVYAEYSEEGPYAYDIVLTTENGYSASNTIVLEPQVLYALNMFCASVEEQSKEK